MCQVPTAQEQSLCETLYNCYYLGDIVRWDVHGAQTFGFHFQRTKRIFWKNTFQRYVSLYLITAQNVKVPGTNAHRTIFQDNSAFFI